MKTTLTRTQIIAGTRPVGSCPPDGRVRWATRSFDDGTWTFTSYNGWLIDDETTTTDIGLAGVIEVAIAERVYR